MMIPPYDSVDYINWSSGFTGASLRYYINDFDHSQVDQMRRLLATSFWFGGDAYARAPPGALRRHRPPGLG